MPTRRAITAGLLLGMSLGALLGAQLGPFLGGFCAAASGNVFARVRDRHAGRSTRRAAEADALGLLRRGSRPGAAMVVSSPQARGLPLGLRMEGVMMHTGRLSFPLCMATLLSPLLARAAVPPPRELTIEQRVEAQRAVEQVYWRHRIWPSENGRAKPALAEVMPDGAIRAKVEDSLKKSNALETLGHRPITARQLQAEMARMARDTQAPDRLGELFAALQNDPTLIAETLARPLLADRLLRNWEASRSNESFESWWTRERERLDDAVPKISATYEPVRLPESNCVVDTWTQRGASPPDARNLHTAVWTGSEMIVWGGFHDPRVLDSGGRYDPATDTWTATTFVGAPTSRESHSAVWTGTEMIVWGGDGTDSTPGLKSGGRYNPATDSWTATSTAAGCPPGRVDHAVVWTGAKMIVWGGLTSSGGTKLNTGGVYDPVADSWVAMSTTGAPAARARHTAVWTSQGMIVWGGQVAAPSNLVNTGAIYDPASDSWFPTSTAGAPSARAYHSAVWSGTQMIVWGGQVSAGTSNTGGRYDPVTDTWLPTAISGAPFQRNQHTAVWTGTTMIVWGGAVSSGGGSQLNSGGRYDPATDSWTATATTGAPTIRYLHTAVWTGTEMIVWGGGSFPFENTGGRYDPSSNSWFPTSTAGAPEARTGHTAVWTGTEMIVWGGYSQNTGGRYDPATDDWTATSTGAGCPGARNKHTAIWTGTEMIVWGGSGYIGGGPYVLNTGGRYNPMTDTWQPTSTYFAPEPRGIHTAVWTGTEMIVWGGADDQLLQYKNTGGRYLPWADAWLPTSSVGAPSARDYHTAVWTGTEMIVWGGYDGSNALNTGARYVPSTDTWTPTSTGAGSPTARYSHSGIWTGETMIIWGGGDILGSRYYPESDSWLGTSTAGVPVARGAHTAVWTGREMIIWGGSTPIYTDTGGRYVPTRDSDSWTPTSLVRAPWKRVGHTAIWFGSRMLVWGGWSQDRTVATYCAPGGCLGLPSACDDGNACTNDSCELATAACSHSPVACDDQNPCTADACDPSSGCGHAPVAGACDDADACTTSDQCNAGVCAGNPTGPPPGDVGPSLRLDVRVPGMEIEWSPAPFAATHDVLRGMLNSLPAGSGAESCVEDGTSASVAYDPTVPPVGSGFWYLVRGQNACGYGTWGTQAQHGVPATPRLSTGCP